MKDTRSFHLKGPFLSPSVILFSGPFVNKGLGHNILESGGLSIPLKHN